ncbi:nucleotidyl transferase AbiEii/AbiGii toxin family protein [Vibrio breoganii]
MLKEAIKRVVEANPAYAEVTSVIEKEILHHDIMDVLVREGAMQTLTFIGETSLRLCYNSSRLSEDLDFNGGHDFKPSNFDGLEQEIQKYIENKYETDVLVSKPVGEPQGNTSSWKISIEKESGRPDLPRQKMHIDVCAIPSFDAKKRPLINHYSIVSPIEGLIIPVQSLEETFADKFIALAYRTRRIKPRDVWDLVWIKQQGISVSHDLIAKKLEARDKPNKDFEQQLDAQVEKLLTHEEVKEDFHMEMSRFVPKTVKERTLDNPDYWLYVQSEIKALSQQVLNRSNSNPFDMSI